MHVYNKYCIHCTSYTHRKEINKNGNAVHASNVSSELCQFSFQEKDSFVFARASASTHTKLHFHSLFAVIFCNMICDATKQYGLEHV